MKCYGLIWVLLVLATPVAAEPIPSGAIQVIDGDTIRANGPTVRLVGFDTPEAGMNAGCEVERTLAAKATAKLRRLIAGGALDLTLVRCACPAATQATQACNRGRACGVLKAAGKDVAGLMITARVAKPYLPAVIVAPGGSRGVRVT